MSTGQRHLHWQRLKYCSDVLMVRGAPCWPWVSVSHNHPGAKTTLPVASIVSELCMFHLPRLTLPSLAPTMQMEVVRTLFILPLIQEHVSIHKKSGLLGHPSSPKPSVVSSGTHVQPSAKCPISSNSCMNVPSPSRSNGNLATWFLLQPLKGTWLSLSPLPPLKWAGMWGRHPLVLTTTASLLLPSSRSESYVPRCHASSPLQDTLPQHIPPTPAAFSPFLTILLISP